MDQNLNQQLIEDIIRSANKVIYNWKAEQRYYLIDPLEVKGLIYNKLRSYCGIWSQQKAFLKSLRIGIIDFQINSIYLISTGNYHDNNNRRFNDYFDKIDYDSLKYTIDIEQEKFINNKLNINFKEIEQITF